MDMTCEAGHTLWRAAIQSQARDRQQHLGLEEVSDEAELGSRPHLIAAELQLWGVGAKPAVEMARCGWVLIHAASAISQVEEQEALATRGLLDDLRREYEREQQD